MQVTMEPIYSLLPRMRNYIYGNIEGEKERTLTCHREILMARFNEEDVVAAKPESASVSLRMLVSKASGNRNAQ